MSDWIVPPAKSPMYADNRQRFEAPDYSQIDAQNRRAETAHKEMVLRRKGAEEYHRDVQRWEKMETARSQHENYLAQQRNAGTGARRNQTGAPLDIFTQEYHHNSKGQAAKFKEEMRDFKHQTRLQNLYTKRNTVTHNIITGELKGPAFTPPQKPIAPWEK